MALIDSAVLKLDSGNYFTAPVGTALPTDLATIGTAEDGWVNIGHTSISDILGNEAEGGEATVLGTLQKPNLRTTYSPRTESFTLTVQQWDKETVKLYFGANMVEVREGLLGVHKNPTPTKSAWAAVFYDGEKAFAFYAPATEILRADNLSLSDTESLSGLPLRVTPSLHEDNDWAYAITPLKPVAPVGAAGMASFGVQSDDEGDLFA